MVQLTDTLTLDGAARICADGSLVAEVFAARTGLQDYLGREVDPENAHGLRDKAIAKVYRPESEVFKTDSLATFAAAPVTLNHPSVAVTADNWRSHGVGEINGDVVREGQRVRVPLIVRDAAAVKAATSTHKQLSMGYATELVFPADGKHPDGTVCDAYQTAIRINHIALVPAARGGPELRIVDERPAPIQEKPVKTMQIDGLTVDVSNADTAEATIKTLLSQRDAATAKVADKDRELAAKDTEIADLKSKAADEATLDARADAKADLVARGKELLGDAMPDVKGKSLADTRRAIVLAATKDATISDKSDDYIEARFDGLKDAAPANPTPTFDRSAYSGSVTSLTNDNRAVRDLARAGQY